MEREWLKAQLAEPGRSQAALGRFMRPPLDASAVNRICQGLREIKVREAEQIHAYLSATARHGRNQSENNLVDAGAPQGAAFIPVRGVVEAGAWREADLTPPGPSHIPVVASGMFEGDVFALRVQGPSMNMFYQDGSYVIVRPWTGGPLPFGKHVVVQRTRQDSGLVECTVKELRRGLAFPELWPRSTDSAHQTPVDYTEEDAEHGRVEIIGRVIANLTFNE